MTIVLNCIPQAYVRCLHVIVAGQITLIYWCTVGAHGSGVCEGAHMAISYAKDKAIPPLYIVNDLDVCSSLGGLVDFNISFTIHLLCVCAPAHCLWNILKSRPARALVASNL